jgi:hypothetical protein
MIGSSLICSITDDYFRDALSGSAAAMRSLDPADLPRCSSLRLESLYK